MELKQLLLEDYFVCFVIKYIENKDINYEINEYILNFLKLIIKMKLNEKPNYEFKNTIDEFVKILLFSQGYKKDLYNIFDTLNELQKYCKNIEEYMKIEEKIKNEICERSNKYPKTFSHTIFLNIIESLIREILLFSIELIKKDKDAFSEFFKFFKFLEDSLQKINIKYNLNSKEIYIIRTIIKIEEECKYNHDQFERNYEKIMDNLLKQANLLYQSNFNNLYNSIIDLNEILNSTFVKKTEEYSNLLLYLFTQQYRNIDNQEIKIKLVENFTKNKLLIKKTKFLLHLTLKDLKPELYNKNKPLKDLIGNFMNITDNNKYLIKIYNNINSEEFNEILLFFFEGQCQSYFNSILMKYKSDYTIEVHEKCIEELLSKTSIEYLKKAMQYLYDHKNNNDNKFLKLYSIAFIKTYLYYYVEIYYNHFDKYNWEEINNILNYKDEKNELVINMINIYVLKLFYKKFENFEMFKNYIFVKNTIPIYKELLDKNPQSLKEIIQENYKPSIFNKNKYPDIQYYSFSNIENYNFNYFVHKFNSSEINKKKYALINILINKESELANYAIKMKNLININRLENLLLNIYSYKITREEGKRRKLKDELNYIKDTYNKIHPIKLNDGNDLIKEYIFPFINSWDQIKKNSVQYKARVLRQLERGEKPLDITIENSLYYFLIDDGDNDGGMFLASAYEHFIYWQNNFINEIIEKNQLEGILHCYVSQLEQEINIEEAKEDEIINIDDNTYKKLNELISINSMRNIFTDENKINYKNYNDIIYNLDIIEEELGKIILPGLKKFKNRIKFMTYLYEEFRGNSSADLVDYINKYNQKVLTEKEKEAINELLKNNNSSKFHNELFSSLQILMNEIMKDNYEQNYSIYKIIESLPTYIIINEEFIKLLKNEFECYPDEKIFTVNSLVSLFEYSEALSWKEIKKYILIDYRIEISEESKRYIIDYFNNINEKNLINKQNFTTALRRLISRSMAGTRQEVGINPDSSLRLYIHRLDLWSKDIPDNDLFYLEIERIFKYDVLVSQCFNLYNVLEGDKFIDNEISMEKKGVIKYQK